MEGERMYTVAEVADQLRLHQQTIREYLRNGVIQGIRLGGTKAGWRIPSTAIDEYLDRARRPRPAAAPPAASPEAGG